MQFRKLFAQLQVIIIFAFLLVHLNSCDIFGNDPDHSGGSSKSEELLFIRYLDGVTELCTIRPDGSNFQVLTSIESNSSHDGMSDAAWSPDKSYIALNGGPNESIEYMPIWLLSNNGEYIRELTWASLRLFWGDECTVYFIDPYDGFCSVDIYTLEKTVLFTPSPDDSSSFLFWSMIDQTRGLATEAKIKPIPGGSVEYENNDIIIYNLQTGEKEYLTTTPDINESCPILSPDKLKVLYRAPSNGPGYPVNLYWFELSNLVPHQITYFTEQNQYQNYPIAWDPNSAKVASTNPHPMEELPQFDPYCDILSFDLFTGQIDTVTHFAADSITSYIVDWK